MILRENFWEVRGVRTPQRLRITSQAFLFIFYWLLVTFVKKSEIESGLFRSNAFRAKRKLVPAGWFEHPMPGSSVQCLPGLGDAGDEVTQLDILRSKCITVYLIDTIKLFSNLIGDKYYLYCLIPRIRIKEWENNHIVFMVLLWKIIIHE